MTAAKNEVGVAASPEAAFKQTPPASNIYVITQQEQNSLTDTTPPTATATKTSNHSKSVTTANDKEAQTTSEKNDNHNNNKFLERVLAAMNSPSPKSSAAKPPIPPTSVKNGVSHAAVDHAKHLLNGTARSASKHVSAHSSVDLTCSTKYTRPPLVASNGTKQAVDNLEHLTQQHDRYDRQSSQLSHSPRVNGFGVGVGVTATTSVAGKVDKASSDSNCINSQADLPELVPVVSVKLKLPLSKPEKMATSTTSKYGSDFTTTSSDRLHYNSSYLARSPSPASSLRSNASSSRCSSISTTSRTSFARLQTPPRRVFPQTYTRGSNAIDLYEMQKLETSPVVFDANMSFVLGCKKQPVHQSVRPSPSYQEDQTSSAYLSEKIQNFLRRTDHVQEEWSAMGRRSRRTGSTDSGRATPTNSLYDDYDTISLIERQRERKSMERSGSIGRSRSSQNILTKAFQLSKTLPSTPTSRSNSMAREVSESGDDRTILEEDDNDSDELSEMTVDLAEERSAANIASERLEAETAERLKLEKELNEQQGKVKSLQESSDKLEMELICAKSDLNGGIEEEDGENEEGGNAVYKLKYERVARELEFTKRRLQTQHEHDLEQLVGLKKQLEKKLSDAYEEVEEQRQVVGQWKRKAQKMTNEMNDLRMLLEEQNARNNLLEKKQRKFDVECQSLQDATRQERQAKERLSREKDVLISEKFTLEQNLSDTRLELELKEEKLSSLQRELEEMTFGGGTEEEIGQLRRSKNELERRLKEQEEELDEMAGQVQMLEQAKLRLEMSLETMRKEARREAQQRDEELEEARGSAYKKIKALECQLETEHEERTLLLREKHELERRLSSMEDRDRIDLQAEEATNQKLRRDLRKYKALLKDAHAQLERLKAETPGKTLIRQLRNQLEDAESARALAMKARQAAEAELAEVQAMFDESHRARNDAEDRANHAHRDRAELQSQIEENEEEMAELMKKYSSAVKQLNSEQIAVSEYEFKLSDLEAERNSLKEQVSELQQRLDNVENMADPSAAMMSKRLELRTKELESRLDLEQATRSRLEVQVNRHKEALEKVQQELSQAKVRELQAQDALKKSQKNLREMREEFHMVSGREQESITKRKDLEKKVEEVESEALALKNDLRLALQRIADLQQAMEEGDDDDEGSESDDSHSSATSLTDLEDRLRPLNVKRTAMQDRNGASSLTVSSTKTLVREKEDNSPRITLTSPSSPHIHTLAAAAKAKEAKASIAAAAATLGIKTTTITPITATRSTLQNGTFFE